MSWFSFLKAGPKFEENLEKINHISVSVSEYVSEEESSYKNFEIENIEQRNLIASLVKEAQIKIPFMGLYESDFETKHWLIQLYANDHSDMYMIYVDKNKIFDKESKNSKLYKYLSNGFN